MVAELVRGIGAQGRSKTYHRRGLWAIKKKHGGKFPHHEKKEKAAEPAQKAAKFYPAEDVKTPLKRRTVAKPARLRASIQPGTVLILLAGHFKGKRVIFLKQLASGLLLVTGPFKVNGVPLRRVNQAYVIATSASVDVSSVDVAKFDDAYFLKPEKKKEQRAKKGEENFFQEDAEKTKELKPEYIENQKAVDAALAKQLTEELSGYLKARFTLRNGDRPHLMKF